MTNPTDYRPKKGDKVWLHHTSGYRVRGDVRSVKYPRIGIVGESSDWHASFITPRGKTKRKFLKQQKEKALRNWDDVKFFMFDGMVKKFLVETDLFIHQRDGGCFKKELCQPIAIDEMTKPQLRQLIEDYLT